MKSFIASIGALLSQGKTTGENHSESMLHYTQMNVKRMERWEKKGALIPEVVEELNRITEPQNWVVLTEAWCGDAAHALPFISKMAEVNPLISFEIKLRDENLELMDQFLTNGGRSIPKLIAYNESNQVLFDWGPRPQFIQEEFLRMRKEGVPYQESSKVIQQLYNKDKGITMQKEILSLLQSMK